MDPLAFVEQHGIVLASARGPAPSLAEHVAGQPIRGSWWGHPRGRDIFRAFAEVDGSGQVLICRLIDGKRTFVHRRLWPALLRLQPGPFSPLDRVSEEHTPSGKHVSHTAPWPSWLPAEAVAEAQRLSEEQARAALGEGARYLAQAEKKSRRKK
ncbi:MAG: hypothetical protein E6J78_20565 [Deltaproteobacteria bacterium]|nr:MAG: hypothetical protein E6J78_20565 [Deltaproteobacteria bacterium]